MISFENNVLLYIDILVKLLVKNIIFFKYDCVFDTRVRWDSSIYWMIEKYVLFINFFKCKNICAIIFSEIFLVGQIV